MFTSHLHDLRRSNPEVLGLLNILVFWDPDGIEFETIKTGALSLHSLFEPTQEPSESEQNRHWTQWFARSLMRILYFGFAFNNKTPATDASNLKPGKTALPSTEQGSLIKLVSSEVQLQSALQQLQMLSFIKRRSAHEGGAYCMHDLTQTLVQVALESEGTYLQWFRCSVRIVCGAFRQIEDPALPESWSRYEGLISHILSLIKYSELVDPKNVDLLTARTAIAAYWGNRGRYYEAREAYQQLLRIGSNVLHDADIETQWKLGLAEVNWHLGKLDESILLYDEVRQIRESRLGADHPDTLHAVEKLALVYRSQARFAEARSMLERVLESRKTSLGPDHLDTIQAIEYLAMTINEYAEAENAEAYAEAESLHKQALAHREAQLGVDHLDTLWTADSLATNYRAQGRHLEAVEIYERVLEGRKLQLGEDHPQTIWTLANIASAYTSLGRWNEAEVMWKQAIVYNEQRRGHNHSQTLFAVEGLADVYHQQSRFDEAINLYNRALRGNEESLGNGHPSVMRKMHKLANLYRDQNDYIKSIALFERLLERRKTRLGSGHPDMLRTYHDAATLYTLMGNYIEAEQCYRLELAGSIEEFGGLHPETKKRELNLATFLRDQAEAAEGGAQGAVANEEVTSAQQSLNDRQE
jgi:tetratricopeptide (TPR) repeat protein